MFTKEDINKYKRYVQMMDTRVNLIIEYLKENHYKKSSMYFERYELTSEYLEITIQPSFQGSDASDQFVLRFPLDILTIQSDNTVDLHAWIDGSMSRMAEVERLVQKQRAEEQKQKRDKEQVRHYESLQRDLKARGLI